jgi:hypothetical protein
MFFPAVSLLVLPAAHGFDLNTFCPFGLRDQASTLGNIKAYHWRESTARLALKSIPSPIGFRRGHAPSDRRSRFDLK